MPSPPQGFCDSLPPLLFLPVYQVSILVSMSASERLGLRLRDVHAGCGGGVVVVGFEPQSPAKRAGIQQGDRITRVDGETS